MGIIAQQKKCDRRYGSEISFHICPPFAESFAKRHLSLELKRPPAWLRSGEHTSPAGIRQLSENFFHPCTNAGKAH
jgi:hypothetical protein